jgi:transposase
MGPKIYGVCGTRDPEEIAKKLKEIYYKVGSKDKAAKKMGISKMTLYQWYAKYKVDVPPEYPKTRPHTRVKRGYYVDLNAVKNRLGYKSLRRMLTFCDNKYTYLQAAEVLGISTGTYRKLRREYGFIQG